MATIEPEFVDLEYPGYALRKRNHRHQTTTNPKTGRSPKESNPPLLYNIWNLLTSGNLIQYGMSIKSLFLTKSNNLPERHLRKPVPL